MRWRTTARADAWCSSGAYDLYEGYRLADTWESDGNTWVQRTPGTSPPARDGHAMAYDSTRGRVVLFGGFDYNRTTGITQIFADTWEWDGDNWISRAPSASPHAREGHAMAYDSARGRVVLFGGSFYDDTSQQHQYFADTWEWDGSTWIQRTPATSPPALHFAAMAYDSTRGRVVLFGGYRYDYGSNQSQFFADTWEWDGDTWVQRTPESFPSARLGAAMAYDGVRGRVVLFGGLGSGNLFSGDTWEWDGNDWAQKATSPSARQSHAMAYDGARGRAVLFGGSTRGRSLADTWEWEGNNWVERTPSTSPPARAGHAMAYDSARERVVLFGGAIAFGSYLADTWEWDGDSWIPRTPGTSPPARQNHAMAYDSARGVVLLFGGSYYDANRQLQRLADTWEWDGNTWVQRTPATSPPAREYHAMAYDSARGRVVLFGGKGTGSLVLADTWEWDGSTWTRKSPANSQLFCEGSAMAYDSARGRVVRFGGWPTPIGTPPTWEWDGNTWVQRTPAASRGEPRLLRHGLRQYARGRRALRRREQQQRPLWRSLGIRAREPTARRRRRSGPGPRMHG